MIKILVTGANGQMGQALRAISTDYTDVVFVFLNSMDLDITNKEVCESILEKYQPDVVVNFAAYTAVELAEEEPEKAYAVNAFGVKLLSELCQKSKITLVHISTDYVFDGLKGKPYTTLDFPNPLNVYGASKLKGEQYIQENMKDYYIIRTSWVYSNYGKNFKRTMLELSTKLDEIKVVDDQIGCPTSAEDIGRTVMKCVLLKPSFGIYHYCGSDILSWYGFAKRIFKEKEIISSLLIPIDSIDFKSKVRRPLYSVLEVSKIFE